jgi:hypothetical protein
VSRLRYSVPAVCRRSELRPPTIHSPRLSLLLLAVPLGLCALRCAEWPTFQAPQGMGLQKVFKPLWWRRLRTLRAHGVPPMSNVPDWSTNLLTRGVHREGQHQSLTAGAHFALDLSPARMRCRSSVMIRNVCWNSPSRSSATCVRLADFATAQEGFETLTHRRTPRCHRRCRAPRTSRTAGPPLAA